MKTITLNDIHEFIRNASDSDMVSIQYAIKYRQESKRAAVKRNISLNDTVRFNSSKDAGLYVGVVTKIARKRAHVRITECANLRFPIYRIGTIVTVPMEMLNF